MSERDPIENVICPLKGFSGCSVRLMRRGGTTFVRKQSPSADYDERLVAQAQKQQQLLDLGFPMPAILDEYRIAGRYAFDMEFINGTGFRDFLLSASRAEIYSAAAQVEQIIARCAKSDNGTLASDLFLEKIANIVGLAYSAGWDAGWQARILKIVEALNAMQWNAIPNSLSHGDLTLENMIVGEDGNIYVLDCLDGPLNSWWLDFAKILQDTQAQWFLRDFEKSAGHTTMLNHLAISCQVLGQSVTRKSARLSPEILARKDQLLAFQLFRIVPFCKTQSSLEFVLTRIEQLAAQEFMVA